MLARGRAPNGGEHRQGRAPPVDALRRSQRSTGKTKRKNEHQRALRSVGWKDETRGEIVPSQAHQMLPSSSLHQCCLTASTGQLQAPLLLPCNARDGVEEPRIRDAHADWLACVR